MSGTILPLSVKLVFSIGFLLFSFAYLKSFAEDFREKHYFSSLLALLIFAVLFFLGFSHLIFLAKFFASDFFNATAAIFLTFGLWFSLKKRINHKKP